MSLFEYNLTNLLIVKGLRVSKKENNSLLKPILINISLVKGSL